MSKPRDPQANLKAGGVLLDLPSRLIGKDRHGEVWCFYPKGQTHDCTKPDCEYCFYRDHSRS